MNPPDEGTQLLEYEVVQDPVDFSPSRQQLLAQGAASRMNLATKLQLFEVGQQNGKEIWIPEGFRPLLVKREALSRMPSPPPPSPLSSQMLRSKVTHRSDNCLNM